MGSENIFDIWRFLGKGTPFIVDGIICLIR